ILPLAATARTRRASSPSLSNCQTPRLSLPQTARLVCLVVTTGLATHARHLAAGLLKRHLGEAPELPRVQAFSLLPTQAVEGFQSNLEMLADTLAVELAGHPSKLDLPVQRFV